MKAFWLAFVPLFVAVDAIGLIPTFLAFTDGLDRTRTRRLIVQSVCTAAAVALAFLAGGRPFLAWLGITIADFMIAGGVLLLVLSVADLLAADKPQGRLDAESLGAVPLGVPLITGPAVLATVLLLHDQHGLPATALALAANMLLAGGVFWFAGTLHGWLGKSGAKALSKVASLLLAAIAVMIIRRGVEALLAGAG